jgi:hypothetical protein
MRLVLVFSIGTVNVFDLWCVPSGRKALRGTAAQCSPNCAVEADSSASIRLDGGYSLFFQAHDIS